MKYTFSIKRNIHMYNHLLTVSDEQMCYEAIVESVPLERETMVIWLENFSFPAAELDAKVISFFIVISPLVCTNFCYYGLELKRYPPFVKSIGAIHFSEPFQ